MVNPTIEEVGHYRPNVGKCQICREYWGLHSIEEENDHGMKILDWLEKKEIAQKISENADLSILINPNMVRVLREYFKNSHAPARDGTYTQLLIRLAFSLCKDKGVFTAKEIREYFKNIPPMKAQKDWLTKEQRRELQIEIEKKNKIIKDLKNQLKDSKTMNDRLHSKIYKRLGLKCTLLQVSKKSVILKIPKCPLLSTTMLLGNILGSG